MGRDSARNSDPLVGELAFLLVPLLRGFGQPDLPQAVAAEAS
jgi:hypothetical protein